MTTSSLYYRVNKSGLHERKLSVLAFLVFFILFGCTKDSPDTTEPDSDENTEEPEVLTNEVYFTLKIPEDYFTSEFEGWVIAHDHDGQILNYRKLENNSSFSFEKPKLKYKYSQEITLLTVFKNNGNTYHNLNTYTFVQDSAIWELTKETISDYSSERGQEIGKFTMNVNDLISPAIYKITNKNGTPSFLSGSTTFNNGSTTFSLMRYHYMKKTTIYFHSMILQALQDICYLKI